MSPPECHPPHPQPLPSPNAVTPQILPTDIPTKDLLTRQYKKTQLQEQCRSLGLTGVHNKKDILAEKIIKTLEVQTMADDTLTPTQSQNVENHNIATQALTQPNLALTPTPPGSTSSQGTQTPSPGTEMSDSSVQTSTVMTVEVMEHLMERMQRDFTSQLKRLQESFTSHLEQHLARLAPTATFTPPPPSAAVSKCRHLLPTPSTTQPPPATDANDTHTPPTPETTLQPPSTDAPETHISRTPATTPSPSMATADTHPSPTPATAHNQTASPLGLPPPTLPHYQTTSSTFPPIITTGQHTTTTQMRPYNYSFQPGTPAATSLPHTSAGYLNGPSPDTLILGDSNLTNIRTSDLTRNCKIKTIHHGSLDTLGHWVNGKLTWQPSTCIIYGGLFDLLHNKIFYNDDDPLADLSTLVYELKRKNEVMDIYICQIAPSLQSDTLQTSISDFNDKIKQWCSLNGISSINTTPSFLLDNGKIDESCYHNHGLHQGSLFNRTEASRLLKAIRDHSNRLRQTMRLTPCCHVLPRQSQPEDRFYPATDGGQ